MSSNFLQRFKGKTQLISKEGVTDILGSKNPDALHNPNQTNKERNYNSANNTKNTSKNQIRTNLNQIDKKGHHAKVAASTATTVPKKIQNPFLISNPFYLDEEEKERQQLQKKQQKRLEQQIKKAQLKQVKQQKLQKESHQVAKTSLYSRSQDKKKGTSKEWTKLGGLGANIGGDQWVEKKKKLQKMQEFAGQVKSVNAERIKPPRPDMRKQETKQSNTRQKALDYSKNVPKPVVRRAQKEETQDKNKVSQNDRYPEEEGLTELQLYQMKHEQLKKMIHNQY